MTRGVLLLALGHPQYGGLAYNLANSIKIAEPGLPIALAAQASAIYELTPAQMVVFDDVIELAPELYTYAGKFSAGYAKTRLNDISPFDQTLFLDADTILFENKRLSEIFKALAEVDYYAHPWIRTGEIHGQDIPLECYAKDEWINGWTAYANCLRYWQFSAPVQCIWSHVLYWCKTPETQAFWDCAKEIYAEIASGEKPVTWKTWTAAPKSVPDELVFAIASGLTGLRIAPQFRDKQFFACAHDTPTRIITRDLKQMFYGVTIPGDGHTHWTGLYDQIVRANDKRFPRGKTFRFRRKTDLKYQQA